MRRRELAKQVSKETTIPFEEVLTVLNKTLEVIMETLAQGNYVFLRGDFLFRPIVAKPITKSTPNGIIHLGERVKVQIIPGRKLTRLVREGRLVYGWKEGPKIRCEKKKEEKDNEE